MSNIKDTVELTAFRMINKDKVVQRVRDECEKRKTPTYGVMSWIDSTVLATEIAYEESCNFAKELIVKTLEELLHQDFQGR